MSEVLEFSNRQSFREWLINNAGESGGVWLLIGKKGGPETLTAGDALEEALCFGWIDGQMQSIDCTRYKKYFARRTQKSHWSERNKSLAKDLIKKGLMTQQGMDAIEQAKKNGFWDTVKSVALDEEQIEQFKNMVCPYESAYTNLLGMSLSVQKTYARAYFDAKSEKTRQTRLEKIVGRLNQNLKPM